MQDGAPVHFTTEAEKFLSETFRGRVISRGTDNAWPAHSPVLILLDFYFWAVVQRRVYVAKPSTIAELINVVKQFPSEINEEVLENVALKVLDRARLCLQVNGGHFQQLMKSGSKILNGRMCVKIIKNPLMRNTLVYHYPLFFLLGTF